MASRRDVLKCLGAALFSSAGGAFLITNGCSAGLATYRAKISQNKIVIPKAQAPQLASPNGILQVYAPGLSAPIILRFVEGHGVVALLSVCTHRSCEVRPFPDSLVCPCHDSEYDIYGEVVDGPARQPLKRFEVEDDSQAWIIKIS